MCLYNRLGWHLMLPPIVTLTWGHCNKQAQSPYDLRCHKPLLMKQTDIIVVPKNLCLEAVVDGVNCKTRIFIQCLCLFVPLHGCVRGIVTNLGMLLLNVITYMLSSSDQSRPLCIISFALDNYDDDFNTWICTKTKYVQIDARAIRNWRTCGVTTTSGWWTQDRRRRLERYCA